MKDHLLDIVKHTQALGNIDLVKITGTKDGCSIDTMSDDRSVIVQAKFKEPVAEFQGQFGMPNLNRLNILLNIPEYREDAVITVATQNRSGVDVPVGLNFKNKAADFKNDYRFMSTELVNDKLKTAIFRGANWHVVITPTVANIMRLKYQAQAHSDENFFMAKTDGKSLKFFFGDHSSHAGDFVFQDGVSGSLSKPWKWPVNVVISILNLSGDKTMYFSDDGAAQITVDSGLAVYNYILPAQSK